MALARNVLANAGKRCVVTTRKRGMVAVALVPCRPRRRGTFLRDNKTRIFARMGERGDVQSLARR